MHSVCAMELEKQVWETSCIKTGTIRRDVKNAGVARRYRNAHSNSFRAYRHIVAQVEVHAQIEKRRPDVGGPLLLLRVHNFTLNDRARPGGL